jgi:ribonuclease VapC
MLDASALLAYLGAETGGETVPANTGDARISAVNYSETVAVLTGRGASAAEVRAMLSSLLLDIVSFDGDQAVAAGFMIAITNPLGLSLGDRACLAAAQSEGVPVMTAERTWSKIDIGVAIQLIR